MATLSRKARQTVARANARGKMKLKEAAVGAVAGAGAGLAFSDRFPEIVGVDGRIVAGIALMMMGRGKRGAMIQGFGFGLTVIPAANFVVDAVENSGLAQNLLGDSGTVNSGISRPPQADRQPSEF